MWNCQNHTIVEKRIPIAEVNHSRKGFDAVTFGQLGILNFDHLDAKKVALVVNVLQFEEHLITGFAIWFV